MALSDSDMSVCLTCIIYERPGRGRKRRGSKATDQWEVIKRRRCSSNVRELGGEGEGGGTARRWLGERKLARSSGHARQRQKASVSCRGEQKCRRKESKEAKTANLTSHLC